jgi:branched-chain amino acid transport system substrate-binding protein
MKKGAVLVVLFFILTTIAVYSGGGSETSEVTAGEEPIHIGAFADMTGESAGGGMENYRAITLYIELLNGRGGISGYPVVLDLVDGQSDPAVYATKAHRMLDSMKVIVGMGGNDITTATAAGKIFQDKKTPFLDIGGTTATIPYVGDYMFMVPTPDNDQGRAMAKYMHQDMGFDKIAIMKDLGSSYGTKLTEYIEYFFKKFTGDEGSVPFEATYYCGDTDYTAQLTRLKEYIKSNEIDTLVLPMWPEDAPLCIKQARQMGIKLPFVGSDGPDTAVLTQIAPVDAEGMIMSTLYATGQPGVSDTFKSFAKELEKRFKEDMGAYGAMSFDCLTIIASSISSVIDAKGKQWWDGASLESKRKAVRDAIAAIDTKETSMPLTFTKDRTAKRGMVWKVVKNGERIFLDLKSYDSFTPPGINPMPFM